MPVGVQRVNLQSSFPCVPPDSWTGSNATRSAWWEPSGVAYVPDRSAFAISKLANNKHVARTAAALELQL